MMKWVIWVAGGVLLGFALFFSDVGFFDRFSVILQIIIWPLTVFGILYLFRRVADYLFLSLRSFNFLGAKGELKPVDEVIEARAIELIESEREKGILNRLAQIFDTGQVTDDELEKIERFVARDKEGGVTLADLVELFISLGIIPADKAEAARTALKAPDYEAD